MTARWGVVVLAALLTSGCPEDDEIVGGPCDDDRDCPAPLTCASDVCIDVTDAVETWQGVGTDTEQDDASDTAGTSETGEATTSSSTSSGSSTTADT